MHVYCNLIINFIFFSSSLFPTLSLPISLSLSLSSGSIRFLAHHSSMLVVGNVNGTLNIIDIRTGELIGCWKPTEKWPLPVSKHMYMYVCYRRCVCMGKCCVTSRRSCDIEGGPVML